MKDCDLQTQSLPSMFYAGVLLRPISFHPEFFNSSGEDSEDLSFGLQVLIIGYLLFPPSNPHLHFTFKLWSEPVVGIRKY
jgi:hypothetical protein